jgi:predicted RNA-binding Zn ribbon-like protein
MYRLFSAFVAQRPPDPGPAARIARRWRAARLHQELIAHKHRYEVRLTTNPADLEHMLVPVVISAVDLLTSDHLAPIRRCVECDWLFLDTSKNGTRRWCKSTCGNRARARVRYFTVRRTRRTRRTRQ